MNGLPKHEKTEREQASAEFLTRMSKKINIRNIVITLVSFFLFGVLVYCLKSSGVLFSIL